MSACRKSPKGLISYVIYFNICIFVVAHTHAYATGPRPPRPTRGPAAGVPSRALRGGAGTVLGPEVHFRMIADCRFFVCFPQFFPLLFFLAKMKDGFALKNCHKTVPLPANPPRDREATLRRDPGAGTGAAGGPVPRGDGGCHCAPRGPGWGLASPQCSQDSALMCPWW